MTAGSPSPVRVATEAPWARYRVLRSLSRGSGRSVNRNCAGRNASSVKVSSPDKHSVTWWPSQYREAKATPEQSAGTAGVQVHGMYRRSVTERERSGEVEPKRREYGSESEGKERHPSPGQFFVQKSDALVVAMKRSNARGAKGGTDGGSRKPCPSGEHRLSNSWARRVAGNRDGLPKGDGAGRVTPPSLRHKAGAPSCARTNHLTEEPDALIAHVRFCEGPRRFRPSWST
jgi:hypothetical protein